MSETLLAGLQFVTIGFEMVVIIFFTTRGYFGALIGTLPIPMAFLIFFIQPLNMAYLVILFLQISYTVFICVFSRVLKKRELVIKEREMKELFKKHEHSWAPFIEKILKDR